MGFIVTFSFCVICIYMYVCGIWAWYVHMSVQVYSPTWRPEEDVLRCFPLYLSNLFPWKRFSHWTGSLPFWLGCFLRGRCSQTRFSCLNSKCFCQCSISQLLIKILTFSSILIRYFDHTLSAASLTCLMQQVTLRWASHIRPHLSLGKDWEILWAVAVSGPNKATGIFLSQVKQHDFFLL